MRIFIPNKSSRALLIGLIAAHVFGTLFAYTVYANVSSLGDGYNPESYYGIKSTYENQFSSTVFVWGIYFFVGKVLPFFLAPMGFGLIAAILIWHAFRDVYIYTNRQLFWVCNLFPHFLIWSGSSSKEQIVIICGIIIINFVARRLFSYRISNISLLFTIIALAIIFIVRPNYFAIYITIFITAFSAPLLNSIITERLSIGIWFVTFILSISLLTFALTLHETFFSEDVINFMMRARHSFLAYTTSGSNRTDIQWNNLYDFFYTSIWGIPQGFIGPTFMEILSKPVQAPAFLEGVIYLMVILYLLYKLIQLGKSSRPLRVHIFPFIFVGFCIIFVSYPYLIFNPGSALRYKQALHPLLVLYPLLILAYNRANYFTNTNFKK